MTRVASLGTDGASREGSYMLGGSTSLDDAITAADAALERSRTMAAAGQERAALANVKQAVRLYRQLARDEPDVFQPDLALALQTQSDLLATSGSADDALATALEAVGYFRRLANIPEKAVDAERTADGVMSGVAATTGEPAALADADDAEQYRPYLGAALGTLAARLRAAGADDEALATVREGIHLFDNADPDDLRRHRQALDAARLLRNELSPDEHLLDEEFGPVLAGSDNAHSSVGHSSPDRAPERSPDPRGV